MQHPPLITRQLRRWSRISLPLIGVGIICLLLASLLNDATGNGMAMRIIVGTLASVGGTLLWINGLILAFLGAVWLLRWARIAIME